MYACTYVHSYVCLYIHTYICTYVRTHVCAYIVKINVFHTYVCTKATNLSHTSCQCYYSMYAHTYNSTAYANALTYVCTYVHPLESEIQIATYIHTYIHNTLTSSLSLASCSLKWPCSSSFWRSTDTILSLMEANSASALFLSCSSRCSWKQTNKQTNKHTKALLKHHTNSLDSECALWNEEGTEQY